MEDIHSCGLYCERPECVRRQRDEMRDNFLKQEQIDEILKREFICRRCHLRQDAEMPKDRDF